MRLLVLAALGVTLTGAALRLWGRYGEDSVRITFFDVGQGDGALIQVPGGAVVLVDAGGGEPGRDLGRRVLFPELTRLGILRLDEAVLSHPDQDHGLGFEGLMPDLEVGRLRFNRRFLGERGLMERLRKLALARRIPLEPVEKEGRLPFPGGEIRYTALSGRGHNDRTLAAELTFAGCRALFTGDMEKEGEGEMLSRRVRAPVDLLKVPHHGSLTSSTPAFLDGLHPFWAVISVGRGNSYGHPRARVLERYRARHIPVLRTDFHGYIRFTIFPSGEVTCQSDRGPCGWGRCHAISN